MKLIEIDQLEVGDEVLISCQSYFKYLKILRKPVATGKTTWRSNPRYKTVKCSTRRTERDYTYTGWNNRQITRTEIVWELTSDDHNFNQYVNFNDRQIILVKKNDD